MVKLNQESDSDRPCSVVKLQSLVTLKVKRAKKLDDVSHPESLTCLILRREASKDWLI